MWMERAWFNGKRRYYRAKLWFCWFSFWPFLFIFFFLSIEIVSIVFFLFFLLPCLIFKLVHFSSFFFFLLFYFIFVLYLFFNFFKWKSLVFFRFRFSARTHIHSQRYTSYIQYENIRKCWCYSSFSFFFEYFPKIGDFPFLV